MKSPLFLIPFIAALAIVLLRTHYRKVWDRVRVPFLIAAGILSAAVVCIMIGSAVVMVSRNIFSLWEKILYCAVIAGMIAFFVWMNVSCWRNNKKGCKNGSAQQL